MNNKTILAVGSMALDTVETPFGKAIDALGGSVTYFSSSARFFAPVSAVAVVGEDFPAKHLTLLKKLGIATHEIKMHEGKTFRWHGRYSFDLNNPKTLKTELNVFLNFKPDLSAESRRAKTVFLANIDPDIQHSVLSQTKSATLTACDTMNFWIENKKPSLIKLLSRVNVFLCNDSEARELSGEFNLLTASRWILSKGPKLVVIKKGEHGVICFSKEFTFSVPAYLLEKIFDPTGAGDTFAGGFMGYLSQVPRLTPQSIKKAVIYGSVLASYNVESFSLNRLVRLKKSDIEARYKKFRDLTRF